FDRLAVAAHKQKLIAFRESVFDERCRQRSEKVLIDGPLQRSRAHLRREAAVQEKFDSRGFPFNRPIASAQTATVKYLVQFFTDDGAHERTRQRPEDNDLIEPIYELRAKSLPHDPQHLVFGKDCGAGSETDLRTAMAGRAEIGGEDDEAVPEICDPTAGIRQPAIVENLQKQMPDIGMRFLELVKKNDSKGLFSDPLDERVGVRPIAIAAENSGRRFSRLKLAHVETSHAIGRTE